MPSEIHPSKEMLEMLVCPLTRTALVYDEENQELISKLAKLAFPIRDGIPVMIASEARELDASPGEEQ